MTKRDLFAIYTNHNRGKAITIARYILRTGRGFNLNHFERIYNDPKWEERLDVKRLGKATLNRGSAIHRAKAR